MIVMILCLNFDKLQTSANRTSSAIFPHLSRPWCGWIFVCFPNQNVELQVWQQKLYGYANDHCYQTKIVSKFLVFFYPIQCQLVAILVCW